MSEENQRWAGPIVPPSPSELADRYAICELAKIYGLGIDLRDYDLCRSAFADSALAEGQKGMQPIDEYLRNTYSVGASFHEHLIANQYVRVNGDEAILCRRTPRRAAVDGHGAKPSPRLIVGTLVKAFLICAPGAIDKIVIWF